MQIKRVIQKNSNNCSCCGNKSVKEFEILMISTSLQEHIFYICFNCQKNTNLESKELINNNSSNKIYQS
jgi:hypothetical protein